MRVVWVNKGNAYLVACISLCSRKQGILLKSDGGKFEEV